MKKIIKFESSWCVPCKNMDAVLEQVKDLFNIEHIDIEKEENQDMVDDYRIMSVPTMIIFDEENRKIERITGTCTVEKLKEYA